MTKLTSLMREFARLDDAEPAQPFNWRAYFERIHGDRTELKCLGKPCHDCAISTNFYTPYAIELAKEDEAFQDRIASRWFCHNNPVRSCAGVRDYLASGREALQAARGGQ